MTSTGKSVGVVFCYDWRMKSSFLSLHKYGVDCRIDIFVDCCVIIVLQEIISYHAHYASPRLGLGESTSIESYEEASIHVTLSPRQKPAPAQTWRLNWTVISSSLDHSMYSMLLPVL